MSTNDYDPSVFQGPLKELIESIKDIDPTDDAERASALDKLQASRTGYVGNFTRKRTQYESARNVARPGGQQPLNDSQYAIESLDNAYERCRVAYGRLVIWHSWAEYFQPQADPNDPVTTALRGEIAGYIDN